jgi:hypothetical protein
VIVQSTKTCTKCGTERLTDEFAFQGKARKDGTRRRASECRECRYKRTREWYRSNLEHIREYELCERVRNRFEVAIYASRSNAKRFCYVPCAATPEELEAAFTGCCQNPGCGVREEEHGRRLCIDHDHETGEFRGWLCNNCNRAAGSVHNSSTVAIGLAAYLESRLSATLTTGDTNCE